MKYIFPNGIAKAISIALFASAVFGACGYRDISTDNGKLAAIQQANSYLNSGMCTEAITVLTPLYQSQYVDFDVRMAYASAYACKAGFSMPTLITNLKGSSSSFWALIVAAMYSTGSDYHLTNYKYAADILRLTTTVSGSLSASDRPSDANAYMILIQTGVLASIISELGVASQSTGKKTVTGFSAGASNAYKCATEVAVTTIVDCINTIGSSGIFSTISSNLSALCSAGYCTNKDPTVCGASNQTNGQAILAAIDSSWI